MTGDSAIVWSAKVFLHLSKFTFFLSLLEVQQLHLSLKPALLFTESFVFEFFLFQLGSVSRCAGRVSSHARGEANRGLVKVGEGAEW